MPGHTVIENEWITLADRTRLAARLWMPEGAGPFPAVLEYLPYRKRDGTSPRDESTYPVFAAAGIAGVRVDIRGSGESDGVIDGEYTPLELANAVELIEWIAAQPWSNGSVGMMGISWGGFNCLQVAALRPKPLKAVISIASTVDRYNDDIHYKNGCHLSAQLSWAATMLAYQSRPPDPAVVGDRWREMWLERLEGEPFLLEEWLSHQRRDGFWRHGSICEDFAGFDVPALVIAGWADGYRNTPFKAAAGVGPGVKAVVGPWIHKYPHFAWPKPRWDFHAEAIRWWNRWLRDEPNGADGVPQMRAYILDGPRPSSWRARDPGFWVAVDTWAAPSAPTFCVDAAGRLTDGDGGGAGEAIVHSPLDTGTASGEWFTLKPDAEMAGDQRPDDAGSLTFDTAPLAEELVLLGQPGLELALTCPAPLANLVARIVDVHPDGTATRVSLGVLNLAHRDGNAEPAPLVPGARTSVRLSLDACGYRLAPGHRLRLALSTAYWPTILPPPTDAPISIDTASLRLMVPLLGLHGRPPMPEPAHPDPLPAYISVVAGQSRRSVERDLQSGRTTYRILEDGGLSEHPGNGLRSGETREEEWSVADGDPLSCRGEARWTCRMERDGWSVTTTTTATLAATATTWEIAASVEAREGDAPVASRTFARSIPRDLM
jgi:putative CocE/NonD family hydrolase